MLNNTACKKTAVVFFLFAVSAGYLFPSDDDVHNRQLLQVLFGRSVNIKSDDGRLFYGSDFTEEKKQKILVLQKALYWCIDEYNGDNPYMQGYPRQYLNDLRLFGVGGVPEYDKINFTANMYHQRYTHRGWDWTLYPRTAQYNFQEIWSLRKNLLLSAIDSVTDIRPEEAIKRDSFGALLYYLHILEDHAGDSKTTYMDRISISRRPDYRSNRSGENRFNPTIITELLYHLPRLFREQTGTMEFRTIERYLTRCNQDKEFPAGNVITDGEYAKLQSFAKEMLDKLIENIPALMKGEGFFSRVFY
ncbi:MAG: hypothetical protein FWH41_05960 [Treponema sp.]|nr:hypothetical protein [Treponema sp.]